MLRRRPRSVAVGPLHGDGRCRLGAVCSRRGKLDERARVVAAGADVDLDKVVGRAGGERERMRLPPRYRRDVHQDKLARLRMCARTATGPAEQHEWPRSRCGRRPSVPHAHHEPAQTASILAWGGGRGTRPRSPCPLDRPAPSALCPWTTALARRGESGRLRTAPAPQWHRAGTWKTWNERGGG